jgi:tRNA(Ile)-lysidine synthase
MKNLKNTIFNFLKANCKLNQHYGIAYSGGSDSKALLYLLVACLKEFKIYLHVLHVNHNWREESVQEALNLEIETKKLKFPFHLCILEKNKKINNLEDKARNERLNFFVKITKKLNLQGIFLAHHADDLAETVLKRVFEGAQLENLGGMRPISSHFSTTFFRPLLKINKNELQLFLSEQKINAIDDITNYDNRFLRARMRKNLFPILEEQFGKSIKNNLVRLSNQSNLLNSYFDEKLKDVLISSNDGPLGSYYNFNEVFYLHLLEKKYLLKKIIKRENLVLNHAVITQILNHLELKIANKNFIFDEKRLVCDRGILFFIEKDDFKIQNKVFFIRKNINNLEFKIGWKAFWLGDIICPVTYENVDIKWFEDFNKADQKKLLVKWGKKKIPVFLRRKAPILCQNGKIIQDVLDSSIMHEGLPTYFFDWKMKI